MPNHEPLPPVEPVDLPAVLEVPAGEPIDAPLPPLQATTTLPPTGHLLAAQRVVAGARMAYEALVAGQAPKVIKANLAMILQEYDTTIAATPAPKA